MIIFFFLFQVYIYKSCYKLKLAYYSLFSLRSEKIWISTNQDVWWILTLLENSTVPSAPLVVAPSSSDTGRTPAPVLSYSSANVFVVMHLWSTPGVVCFLSYPATFCRPRPRLLCSHLHLRFPRKTGPTKSHSCGCRGAGWLPAGPSFRAISFYSHINPFLTSPVIIWNINITLYNIL